MIVVLAAAPVALITAFCATVVVTGAGNVTMAVRSQAEGRLSAHCASRCMTYIFLKP